MSAVYVLCNIIIFLSLTASIDFGYYVEENIAVNTSAAYNSHNPVIFQCFGGEHGCCQSAGPCSFCHDLVLVEQASDSRLDLSQCYGNAVRDERLRCGLARQPPRSALRRSLQRSPRSVAGAAGANGYPLARAGKRWSLALV